MNKIIIILLLIIVLAHGIIAYDSLGFYPKEDKYALLIGINKYLGNRYSEITGEQDVEKFSKWLEIYLNFSNKNIIKLKGESASYYGIQNTIGDLKYKLRNIADKTKRKNLLILYFAGHGTKIPGSYYPFTDKEKDHSALIPWDAVDYPRIGSTSRDDKYIIDEDLESWLREMKNSTDIVFIFDACYQGYTKSRGPLLPEEFNTTIYSKIGVVIAASGWAPTMEKAGGGVFTYAFGEAIQKSYQEGVYKLQDIYDNVNKIISDKMPFLRKEERPIFERGLAGREIVLANITKAAVEISLTELADIKIIDEYSRPLVVEKNKTTVIEIFPINKKIKVVATKEETKTKMEDKYIEKYVYSTEMFTLAPEEYRILNINLRQNLIPGYIKLILQDDKGNNIDLIESEDELSEAKVVGAPEGIFRMLRNGKLIAIQPGVYQEIMLDKEGYKVKSAFNNRTIIVNSDQIEEVRFILQKDPQYWSNKINELKSMPQDVNILNRLGRAYWKNGELKRAYRCYLSAIYEEPKNTKLNQDAYKLAKLLYEKTGNKKYEDDMKHFEGIIIK